MSGRVPKDRLRIAVEDRFIILRLSEPKAMLPEGGMLDFFVDVLSSFTPQYKIICDFRGVQQFTSDMQGLTEALLERGAVVLTPPPPKDFSLRDFDWTEDLDYFIHRIEKRTGRKLPAPLRVRKGELPLRYAELDLSPFKDEDYTSDEEKQRVGNWIGDKGPNTEEIKLLHKLMPWLGKLKKSTPTWELGEHIVAARRAIQYLVEPKSRPILNELILSTAQDSVLVTPYHSHALNNVELRDDVVLARPGVIAHKTRVLLRPDIEQFEQLLSRQRISESELQRFLEEHPQILQTLGYSHIYPHVVLERSDNRSLIPDFILEPVHDEWCDILDLKLPTMRTVVGGVDRKTLSAGAHELVAQLREYATFFEDPRHAKRVEELYGIKCYKPKLVGVIGRDPRLADERQLRRLMTSYTDTKILTFDQLLRVAKSRLLI